MRIGITLQYRRQSRDQAALQLADWLRSQGVQLTLWTASESPARLHSHWDRELLPPEIDFADWLGTVDYLIWASHPTLAQLNVVQQQSCSDVLLFSPTEKLLQWQSQLLFGVDSLVVPTQQARTRLQLLDDDRVRVLPWVPPSPQFRREQSRARARRFLVFATTPVPADCLPEWQSDLELLLQALPRVELELLVARRMRLPRHPRVRQHVLGSSAPLPLAMSCDAAIVLDRDPFALHMVQALRLALPVVAADYAPYRRLSLAGADGFLSPARDNPAKIWGELFPAVERIHKQPPKVKERKLVGSQLRELEVDFARFWRGLLDLPRS